MKTAIRIPDDVFAEAERLTRHLHKSRSQPYTEAIREYLARHNPDAVIEALNQVCDVVDSRVDLALATPSRHLLQRVEW